MNVSSQCVVSVCNRENRIDVSVVLIGHGNLFRLVLKSHGKWFSYKSGHPANVLCLIVSDSLLSSGMLSDWLATTLNCFCKLPVRLKLWVHLDTVTHTGLLVYAVYDVAVAGQWICEALYGNFGNTYIVQSVLSNILSCWITLLS